MTTKNEFPAKLSDADALRVRLGIIEALPEGLADLQTAGALLHGVCVMADCLADGVDARDASLLAFHLRELAQMAMPRVDRAIGDFSDAICELERVAPMLAALSGPQACA